MHPRRAYYLFEAFYCLGVSVTFTSYVPYLQELGLSPARVSWITLWFWLALLICELPTGIFADRVSRVTSIRLGIGITTASCLLYATAVGFLSATLYEILIGVGMSFISGALNAWIKDALLVRGEDEKSYEKTVSTANFYGFAVMFFGGLGGGLLGIQHTRLVWVLAAALLLGAVVIAQKYMREERPIEHLETFRDVGAHAMRPGASPLARPLSLHALLEDTHVSVRILKENRALLWGVIASMCFGLILPFNHYWTPFFESHLGPLGRTLIWGPMCAVQGFAAFAIRWLPTQKDQKLGTLALVTLATGVGLTIMGCSHTLVGIAVGLLLYECGCGAFFPLMETFIQERITSKYRATYSSLHSLLTRLGYVIILGVVSFGIEGKEWDVALIAWLWAVSGVLLALSGALLLALRPAREPKEAATTSATETETEAGMSDASSALTESLELASSPEIQTTSTSAEPSLD